MLTIDVIIIFTVPRLFNVRTTGPFENISPVLTSATDGCCIAKLLNDSLTLKGEDEARLANLYITEPSLIPTTVLLKFIEVASL